MTSPITIDHRPEVENLDLLTSLALFLSEPERALLVLVKNVAMLYRSLESA
jgi:hypothetical protein